MTHEEADALLSAACGFQAHSLEARESCREKYRRNESNEHNILRILIDGEVADLAQQLSMPISSTDERISYQITILTSYIRSHFVINDLIMGGDIVEALTVIRRQIESLARLNEIDSKPLQRLLRRTPNVQNILGKGSGPLYGYLSEVAHCASPDVSVLLGVINEGERVGPSLTPRYSEHLIAAFEVHWFFALYFLVWTIEKAAAWYPDHDHTDAKRRATEALSVAEKAGVLRYPPLESQGSAEADHG